LNSWLTLAISAATPPPDAAAASRLCRRQPLMPMPDIIDYAAIFATPLITPFHILAAAGQTPLAFDYY
jgi:hypothetical protein